MDGNLLYERLSQHCGHNVVIVKYGIGDGCYALECEDCGETICDTDCYNLTGVEKEGKATMHADVIFPYEIVHAYMSDDWYPE